METRQPDWSPRVPRNATIRGDGFRIYRWEGGDSPLHVKYGATEPSDLLSVTSIRTLAGEHFRLVNWKIANVVNLAMGVRKAVRIGPRGGVKEVYVQDGEFPGEFVNRMLETKGEQKAMDEHRRWLRETADEPRDIAAVRGSVVHKMIEMNLPMKVIDRDVIEGRMAAQWAEEKRKQKLAFTDEDYNFVYNAMRQYWDMRAHVPFVVLAQEPQVYNLRAGYGGSADVLIWFLGYWRRREPTEAFPDGEVYFEPLPGMTDAKVATLQRMAAKGEITLAEVEKVGGQLAVGDWKTSKGVYTNHVIQTTAYMAADFVAEDSVIDERLTDLLAKAKLGMVIHIRPNLWAVDLFEFRKDVIRAFLGSVSYARFLALHQEPNDLFIYSLSGAAEGTEGSDIADDSE